MKIMRCGYPKPKLDVNMNTTLFDLNLASRDIKRKINFVRQPTNQLHLPSGWFVITIQYRIRPLVKKMFISAGRKKTCHFI